MKKWITVMAAALCLTAGPLWAEDSPALRAAAAERYVRVAGPVVQYELLMAEARQRMDELMAERRQHIPPAQREAVMAQLKRAFRPEVLERVTRETMVKVYTAEEINALTEFMKSKQGANAQKEFMESKLGASVMQKTPEFMSEIRSAMRADVFKQLTEMQQRETGKRGQ